MLDVVVKNSILNPLADCFIPRKTMFTVKKQKMKRIDFKEKVLMILKELRNRNFNKGTFLKCAELNFLYVPCIDMKSEILSLKLCLLAQLIEWNGAIGNSLAVTNSEMVQKQCTDLISTSNYSEKIKEFKLSNLGLFFLTLWVLFRNNSADLSKLLLTYLKDYGSKMGGNAEQSTISCTCPRVFGCIIPPNFFGNPFHLNYQCKVNHAHIGSALDGFSGCNYDTYETYASRSDSTFYVSGVKQWETSVYSFETVLDYNKIWNPSPEAFPEPFQIIDYIDMMQETEAFEAYENGENRPNLDFYSAQLVDIVTNVCQIVKENVDNDCFVELKGNLTEETIDIKCTEESEEESVISDDEWNSRADKYSQSLWDVKPSMEIPSDKVIMEDDGFHPLLDEGVVLTFDEEVSHEVKEILRHSLSPKKESPKPVSENCLKKTPCDPPCSIWCDSLNFDFSSNSFKNERNCNKSLENEHAGSSNEVQKRALMKQAFVHKPNYRRSFSANDCLVPNNYGEKGMQEGFMSHGFDPLSRARLLLLRKDPVTYFRYLQNGCDPSWQDETMSLSNIGYFPGSYSEKKRVANNHNFYSDQNQTSSGMWGPFDGEDCLWQPLPDCLPSQENVMKSHHNRRVRDLRRQRSLN